MQWPYSGLALLVRGTLFGCCLLGLVPSAEGTVCAAGTVACAGRYGAACYNPAYATCYDGVICSRGSTPCVGRYGAGCYNAAYATCFDGLVCARPLQACVGPFGAQCYAPGQATCTTSPSTPLKRRGRRHPPNGHGSRHPRGPSQLDHW